MFQFLTFVFKITTASIMLGAVLSAFDLSAADILARAGLTPERVAEMIQAGFVWAMPNLILGSMIIVPLWCVSYMLRPPRG